MLYKEKIKQLLLEKGIHYIASRQIIRTADGNLYASGDDPKLIFGLPVAQKQISFSIEIVTYAKQNSISIYYSDSRLPRFDDLHRLVVDNFDGQIHHFTCSFATPVRWIRIDPVDAPGVFDIHSLRLFYPNLQETADYYLSTHTHEIHSSRKSLHMIETKIKSGSWQADSVFVLVTHEISGTGAPLLCRKISSSIKQMNYHCVILSLSAPSSQNFVEQVAFENDCDALFICPQNQTCHDLVKKLSQLGIKRALLNTVVSGKSIHFFKQYNFYIVSLIHEMKSSCKILHAENLIKQIAHLSDITIFPAKCVMDDFLSFGNAINGKYLLKPQGFYRNIGFERDNSMRLKLIEQLGLPQNTQFICGAGAINFGKGVDLLSLIAKKLVKSENNQVEYHFLWIGSSNAADYDIWVKDQIDRMDLSKRFHFAGYIVNEQIYMQYLGASLVYALVSREDSLPSVMIESMACQLPVIAFKGSGGAEEILADERGFLVDYMDIESFSKIIQQIGTQQISVDEVVKNASDFVKNELSFAKYVEFIMAIFHKII